MLLLAPYDVLLRYRAPTDRCSRCHIRYCWLLCVLPLCCLHGPMVRQTTRSGIRHLGQCSGSRRRWHSAYPRRSSRKRWLPNNATNRFSHIFRPWCPFGLVHQTKDSSQFGAKGKVVQLSVCKIKIRLDAPAGQRTPSLRFLSPKHLPTDICQRAIRNIDFPIHTDNYAIQSVCHGRFSWHGSFGR